MRVAVAYDRICFLAGIAAFGIAHLNRMLSVRISLGDQFVEIFAGMFSTGKKKSDFIPLVNRDDAGCKDSGTHLFSGGILDLFFDLGHNREDLHAGIVIMENIVLGALIL